ncbi:MAG: hypothetical protein J0H64_06950 [Actinobacteria bacterium]|nr:hypothetical protein [Actinomycetota bacterium]
MASQQRMSRPARTARGALAALASTLLAATSHALAGGTVTPLSIAATALVALPLCVALAGRLGSFWRLALAVCASQFLYHWSFWGLGISSPAGTTGPAGGHSAHLATVFSPALVSTGIAEAWMWAAHAAAAALTIVLLHQGERAVIGMARLILRTLPRTLPHIIELPGRPGLLPRASFVRFQERLAVLSAISHRGPPHIPLLHT